MTAPASSSSLYVYVKGAKGLRVDNDNSAEIYCTASVASHKYQTKNVKRGSSAKWNDVFYFGEDCLTRSNYTVVFEVHALRRWSLSANSLLGHGELHLDDLHTATPGAPVVHSLTLHQLDKNGNPRTSTDCGSLILVLELQRTGTGLPGALEELSSNQPTGLPPLVVLPPRGAPPNVLHCPAGTLYEEPPLVFLRIVLHSASGLRHAHLDSPKAARHPTRLDPPSSASRTLASAFAASAFVAKSKHDIANFFGLRRRKADAPATDAPPSAGGPLSASTSGRLPEGDVGPVPPHSLPHVSSVSSELSMRGGVAAVGSSGAGSSGAGEAAGAQGLGRVGSDVLPGAHRSGGSSGIDRAQSLSGGDVLKVSTSSRSPSVRTSIDVKAPAAALSPVRVRAGSSRAAATPTPAASASAAVAALPPSLAAAAAVMANAVAPSGSGVLGTGSSSGSVGSGGSVGLAAAGAAGLGAAEAKSGGSRRSSAEASRGSGPIAEAVEGREEGGVAGEGAGQVAEGVLEEERKQEDWGQEEEMVDAEKVIAAMEMNGFHVTDAPGGTHFYFKATYEGQTWTSNMSQQESGSASWEQAFLIAAQRPLPSFPNMELDLFVSSDTKSRGRPACKFNINLQELCAGLEPMGRNHTFPSGTQVIRSFTAAMDETHTCKVRLSADVVDADARAQWFGMPLVNDSALMQHASMPSSTNVTPRGDSRTVTSSPEPMSPPTSPATRPLSFTMYHRQGNLPDLNVASSPTFTTPSPGRWDRASSLETPSTLPPVSPFGSSQQYSPGPNPGDIHTELLLTPDPPAVATLHLLISAFEIIERPMDCFFAFKCGNYWGCSNPLPSTLQARWDWELRLPVADPSCLLSLGLFRDDGAAQKVVAATRSMMFQDSMRAIGRLRVRLSTLLPNKQCVCKLPLHGDRQTAKGGVTTAHVQLAMRMEYNSTRQCCLTYFQPTMYRPCILLMQKMDILPVVLHQASQKILFKWLEDSCPSLPARVARRVMDDGRQEFNLSRTQQNWRRVMATVAATRPFRDAFQHIALWENPLLSGTAVVGVLLFAAFPSKVVALLLVCVLVHLYTTAYRRAEATYGMPRQMVEELQGIEDDSSGVSAPVDPYTALKQQYDSLVTFMMGMQNMVDTLVAPFERLGALISWQDPMATMVLLVVLVVLTTAIWFLGLRVVLSAVMLWLIRPPQLRDPYPPPPVNFIARLPARSDVML